jgi:hypothetical protein
METKSASLFAAQTADEIKCRQLGDLAQFFGAWRAKSFDFFASEKFT